MAETYEPTAMTPVKYLAGTSVTIAAGAGVLKAGSVLGKVSADGKYKLSDDGASDGSEVPDMILLKAVDASGTEDVVAPALKAGVVSDVDLVFGGAHTAASVDATLRGKGLYIVSGASA